MEILIGLSAALIGGLLLSRLAKRLALPAVTAYLVTGLLLGPFCIGALGLSGLGFGFLNDGFPLVQRLDFGNQIISAHCSNLLLFYLGCSP